MRVHLHPPYQDALQFCEIPTKAPKGSQSRQRTVFILKAPKLFEGPYIIRRAPKMSILNATWQSTNPLTCASDKINMWAVGAGIIEFIECYTKVLYIQSHFIPLVFWGSARNQGPPQKKSTAQTLPRDRYDLQINSPYKSFGIMIILWRSISPKFGFQQKW